MAGVLMFTYFKWRLTADIIGTCFLLMIVESTMADKIQTDEMPHLRRNESYIHADYPTYFHQTWLGYTTMPPTWEENIKASIEINGDCNYMRWSNDDIIKLLTNSYPWFVDIYRNYTRPVQKSDAARYFILHKYGGFYMDMDLTPRRSFTDIVKAKNARMYDCILPATDPFGLSNGLMMCKKGSPFMKFVTNRLRTSMNRFNWFVPYLHVMTSTGPLFLTWALEAYENKNEIYVLSQDSYDNIYFRHGRGSTWHEWDAHVIHAFYPWLSKTNIVVFSLIVLTSIILSRRGTRRFIMSSVNRRLGGVGRDSRCSVWAIFI